MSKQRHGKNAPPPPPILLRSILPNTIRAKLFCYTAQPLVCRHVIFFDRLLTQNLRGRITNFAIVFFCVTFIISVLVYKDHLFCLRLEYFWFYLTNAVKCRVDPRFSDYAGILCTKSHGAQTCGE